MHKIRFHMSGDSPETHWASKDPDPKDILILYDGSSDCEPQWDSRMYRPIEDLDDISEWEKGNLDD